ncbi:MAG: hypothetical protein JRI52_04455 [Deltaproteobacteria bacterium]|nr:hypothetical protein [Deltaproteobacteria bacterium]
MILGKNGHRASKEKRSGIEIDALPGEKTEYGIYFYGRTTCRDSIELHRILK